MDEVEEIRETGAVAESTTEGECCICGNNAEANNCGSNSILLDEDEVRGVKNTWEAEEEEWSSSSLSSSLSLKG